MTEQRTKILYWAPRALSILFIAFLAMFSLDVFGQGTAPAETAVAFLLHNIPVILLIILLAVAWKREIVGAAAFTGGGILYVASILIAVLKNGFAWHYVVWAVIVSGPAFLVGALFMMNWRQRGGGGRRNVT